MRRHLLEPLRVAGLRRRCAGAGAQRLCCLGDFGAYGAEPEAIWPSLIAAQDGASPHYGTAAEVRPDPELVDRVARVAADRGLLVHRGLAVTTEVLLRQPDALVARWRAGGVLGVDMESAATVAAAGWAGMRAVSVLHAWDDLTVGRSWTDPLPRADEHRRREAEAALLTIVLEGVLGGPEPAPLG